MDIQESSGLILNANPSFNVGLLIVIIILILLSAFFSMTETVYSTTNTVRLTLSAEDGKKSAQKALWIAEHYERTLTTILVGNNLVNITLATLSVSFFAQLLSNGNIVDFNLINKYTEDLVYTLNDSSYVKPNKTRIEVCCASELVRSLMTETLTDSLLEMGFELKIINMAKEDGVFKNEEILAIANALDIFELEIGGTIDEEKMFNTVLHLNEPYKNGRSKLQAVYASVIMRNRLSNVLHENLTSLNIGEDAGYEKVDVERALNAQRKHNPDESFDIEDIRATIEGIKAVYGENATMDDLKNQPDENVIKENSDIILESDIFRIVLSPYLKTIVDKMTENTDKATIDAINDDITDEFNVYKKEELVGLFKAYEKLTDSETNEFNVNSILSLSESELNEILGSKIVRLSITTTLANTLNDENTVSQDLIKQLKDEDGCYTRSEIAALIGAIKLLSGADENTLLEDAINTAISNASNASMLKANLKTIYDSDIVAGIITKQIQNVSLIKDHPNAHIIPGDCTTAYVYRQNEIKSLLDLVENSFDELTSQDDVISKIGDGNIIENIENGRAYLLVATISDFVVWQNQNNLYVPVSTLDRNQIVNKDEIAAFLRSLNILGVTSLSNGFTFYVPDDFEGLFDSAIIRTTFTQLLKANDSSSLYVQRKNASRLYVVRTGEPGNRKEVVSINEDELIETFTIFIKAELFANESGELSAPTYEDIANMVGSGKLSLNELAESDIMKYMISDIITDLTQSSPIPIVPTEKDDVFVFTEGVQEKTHSYHNIKNFEYLFTQNS